MTAGPVSTTARAEAVERGLGLALSAVVVALGVLFLGHAGPLWRDEVSSVTLAQEPSLAAVWANQYFDSFPVLWGTVLHGWTAAGLGGSDFSIRVFGWLMGTFALACVWVAARALDRPVPVVALTLVGLAPPFLIAGYAVRGYGLGLATMLLMLATTTRLLRRPTGGRVAAAAVAGLAAVHSAYSNVPILLAVYVAGGIGCLVERRRDCLLRLIAIGALCAASMLPYLPMLAFHAQWNELVRLPVETAPPFRFAELGSISGGLWRALGGDIPALVWLGAGLAAVGGCIAQLRLRPSADERQGGAMPAFVLSAILLSAVVFAVYLRLMRVSLNPWYFLPPLVLEAVLFDAGLGMLAQRDPRARLAVCGGAVLAAAALLGGAWTTAHTRMTSIDLVAHRLERLADPEDLILFNPWQAFNTFGRYYAGRTPWVTIPDMPTDTVPDYRAYKRKMAEAAPLAHVHERILATLRSGHRVWLVGDLDFRGTGERVPALPPAPLGPWRWFIMPYERAFSAQTAALVERHALRVEGVGIDAPQGAVFNPFEAVGLQVISGWREPPAAEASTER